MYASFYTEKANGKEAAEGNNPFTPMTSCCTVDRSVCPFTLPFLLTHVREW